MTRRRLAVRVVAETPRGVLEGVPAIARVLRKHDAGATFFFALGPARTARALLAGEHFGAGSTPRFRKAYGWSAWRPGLIGGAPTLSKAAAHVLRATRDAGFEIGVYGWDTHHWRTRVARQPNQWIEDEMAYAHEAFIRVLGTAPSIYASPSGVVHRHQLRYAQQLGYRFSSLGTGVGPYLPIVKGEPIGVVELPTTLPTFGAALEGGHARNASLVARIVDAFEKAQRDAVMTLHADYDGLIGLDGIDSLLTRMREHHIAICTLGSYGAELDVSALARCVIHIEGAATQGKPYFGS